MLSLSLAAVLKWAAFLSFAFLAAVAVVDVLTMSQDRRVRMLSRCGHSQRSIAARLQISRYRVRQCLA
jgi:DNA-binding CsgD family transcriptional regulator